MTMIWVGLLAGIALYAVVTYNQLVRLKTQVAEGWSDIQVQMKRRYDLIPNLVETVKGYATHEKTTLESVISARNAAVASTGTPAAQAASENLLVASLRQLFALSEAYPDLKANQGFLALQKDLNEAETLIQGARRYYNGAVKALNILVDQFPSNLVARGFHFEKAEFFELDSAEAAAASAPPTVKFP